MENIRDIVSNNIITLRKQKQMTQIDLAKKINYSDKAVSRWENGEVIPDVETLQKISQVFGVPVSYMLEKHENEEKGVKILKNPNQLIMQFLAVCVAWVIISVVFVYLQLIYNYIFWQGFVWGVPISTAICMWFNRKNNNRVVRLILRSILNWSLLASVYLQLLFLNNLWLIFIIGVPIQLCFVVAFFAKPKIKEY